MRRHGSPSDPTPRKILAFEGREILYSILDTFSERDAGIIALRFGLTDGRPRSFEEIGRIYGMQRDRVQQIEREVIWKIQLVPQRIDALGVWDEGRQVDTVSIPSYASSLAAAAQIHWCSQCQEVPLIPHDEISKGGRPRKYCSARCRQEAYRARKRIKG